jgi:predicted amino acid dehydrogenase
LLDGLLPSIAHTGARLRERLQRLIDHWPGVFADVRGRGLFLGLELRPIDAGSILLQRVFDPDGLGYLVAGYLLHCHDIRVLPTLSAPTTLRIQPSAYFDEADMDELELALEDVAARIDGREFTTLLDHLSRPAPGPDRLPTHCRPLPRSLDRVQQAVPLVAFLANLEGPATVRRLAPELSNWSDEQCDAVLDRMLGELKPFEVTRSHVRSATAGDIELMVVAVPFTAHQAMSLLRVGERSWLSRAVLDGVEFAADAGAAVIGLGGYTSIVTDAAREVAEDTVRVTTGNSLAAACAYQSIRRRLRGCGSGRVGVVGALGNIGAVLTDLLAEEADSLVLVGRSGSVRRLRQVAHTLGGGRRITVTDDMAALRDCDVVVTASNSPTPVIHPAHLNTDGEVVVYDLAVPGDVDMSVLELPRIGWYVGGRMILPLGQDFSVPGTGLPPGVVHACLAETMLMGFEPGMASLSHGGLTAGGLRAAWDLAARHGYEAFDVIQERSLV